MLLAGNWLLLRTDSLRALPSNLVPGRQVLRIQTIAESENMCERYAQAAASMLLWVCRELSWSQAAGFYLPQLRAMAPQNVVIFRWPPGLARLCSSMARTEKERVACAFSSAFHPVTQCYLPFFSRAPLPGCHQRVLPSRPRSYGLTNRCNLHLACAPENVD